jgi:secreted trypsin-like serine protease
LAISFRARLMAEATLVNLNNTWTDGYNIETQGNGNGRGGTCSGDSGGPVFYPTNTNGPETQVVAVTSFGRTNPNDCVGNDYAYRVDRAKIIAWIDQVSGSYWNP